MTTEVRSFRDYTAFTAQGLGRLPAFAQFSFCVWCLERFEPEFGEAIWDGLSDAERQRGQEILSELRSRADAGVIPPAPLATALRAEVEGFGPQDDEAYETEANELEPPALEFLTAFSNTFGFCQHGELGFACAVAEAMINLRDFEAGGEDGYTLETMFDHASLRRELELQATKIASLSN